VYLAPSLLAAWRAGRVERVRWIIKSQHGHPQWAREFDVPAADVPFKTTEAAAQIVAARQGLGMTLLPCFVGNTEPLLVRAPGCCVHGHGTLWLLTQRETRKTKRVQLLTERLSHRLAEYAPLLAGRYPVAE
jgi:DNA-binding transcriptional LysR family regulator